MELHLCQLRESGPTFVPNFCIYIIWSRRDWWKKTPKAITYCHHQRKPGPPQPSFVCYPSLLSINIFNTRISLAGTPTIVVAVASNSLSSTSSNSSSSSPIWRIRLKLFSCGFVWISVMKCAISMRRMVVRKMDGVIGSGEWDVVCARLKTWTYKTSKFLVSPNRRLVSIDDSMCWWLAIWS